MSPQVPVFLDHLPRCPVRGLPFPFSGINPVTGRAGFGVNDLLAKMICGQRRLCGVCGGPLPEQFTFLAADHGGTWRRPVFRDPPSCWRCVAASMRLCPHIASPAEPGWLAWITRSYELIPDLRVVAFRAGPAVNVRRFAYRDGRLIEHRAVRPAARPGIRVVTAAQWQQGGPRDA